MDFQLKVEETTDTKACIDFIKEQGYADYSDSKENYKGIVVVAGETIIACALLKKYGIQGSKYHRYFEPSFIELAVSQRLTTSCIQKVQIDFLCVHPSFKQRGYGSMIMNYIKNKYVGYVISLIVMMDNNKVINFYKKFGATVDAVDKNFEFFYLSIKN